MKSSLSNQDKSSFLCLRWLLVAKKEKYIFQLTFIYREYVYLYWRIPGIEWNPIQEEEDVFTLNSPSFVIIIICL